MRINFIFASFFGFRIRFGIQRHEGLLEKSHVKCLRSFGGFGQWLIVDKFLSTVVHVNAALHVKDRRLRDEAGGKGFVARIQFL